MIFTFLLNQEHGVNNESSQSIQSIRHSKWTRWMVPTQEDRSARKNVFLAHSWQSSVYRSMACNNAGPSPLKQLSACRCFETDLLLRRTTSSVSLPVFIRHLMDGKISYVMGLFFFFGLIIDKWKMRITKCDSYSWRHFKGALSLGLPLYLLLWHDSLLFLHSQWPDEISVACNFVSRSVSENAAEVRWMKWELHAVFIFVLFSYCMKWVF